MRFSLKYLSLLLLLCAVFMLAPPLTSKAETRQSTAQEPEQYVQTRLLPEYGAIQPGQEIWVGIEQSIYPHWHTYWVNPGDSGSAARINWSLPEGFEISEFYWPAPTKIPYDPLLNYGYEDHVTLLQKLKAPEILPDGPLKFSADFEVLVCKEECIPEFGTYEFTLNGPNAQDENNHDYLLEARASLPIKTDWSVFYGEVDGQLTLDFSQARDLDLTGIDLNTLAFFPLEWGVIDNPQPVQASPDNGALTLSQARGDRALSAVGNIEGVLTFSAPDGKRQAAQFTAKPAATMASALSEPTSKATSGSINNALPKTTFISALIFALLGGIVLNLMPCVFPVLSIKALSLVKIAEKHPEQARMHGLSYTGGVILSFLAIAGALIALKMTGAEIGWGFQLQNPLVVGLLAYLLFIIGLNLSGMFEFGANLTNIGGKLTQKRNDKSHGYSNSFFTGVLATLVATPCTAPFMGVAIGFALLQPAIVSLTIFAALGFGLALPYLLLSVLPSLQHIMPKPGAWMEIFKQLLAFPMYASAAWLVWVLSQQAGSMGTIGALMGMIAIAFGIWLLAHKPKNQNLRIFVIILAAISFLGAVKLLPSGGEQSQTTQQQSVRAFGEVFSNEALESALSTNDPVFVEMTAAWCITCKVNHAAAININSTKALFAEKNVRFLIGDWTNQDPKITQYLDLFGRNGVPLYVYYGAPDANGIRPAPKILPQILTPSMVADTINT